MRRLGLAAAMTAAILILGPVPATRAAPAPAGGPVIVVGTGPGETTRIRAFTPEGAPTDTSFFPFTADFAGGVSIAVGNVIGDGALEIVAGAGAGGGPHVRVFSMAGVPVGGFFAYSPGFRGGINVAVGDLDGDEDDEIIVGAGPGGGPHVRAFQGDGAALGGGFMAYDSGFRGGVNVAAGRLNRDPGQLIVTGAGPGGGPHLRVFTPSGAPVGQGWFAFHSGLRGGVYVGVGDVDGDGVEEIVTGIGAGGGPHVRLFDDIGISRGPGFYAYNPNMSAGVRVAVADLDQDPVGQAEIVVGPGPGAPPHIRAVTETGADAGVGFVAFSPSSGGGVVAAAPLTAL